jgi:hypothetical protein
MLRAHLITSLHVHDCQRSGVIILPFSKLDPDTSGSRGDISNFHRPFVQIRCLDKKKKIVTVLKPIQKGHPINIGLYLPTTYQISFPLSSRIRHRKQKPPLVNYDVR